jgi:hypothetical protein
MPESTKTKQQLGNRQTMSERLGQGNDLQFLCGIGIYNLFTMGCSLLKLYSIVTHQNPEQRKIALAIKRDKNIPISSTTAASKGYSKP